MHRNGLVCLQHYSMNVLRIAMDQTSAGGLNSYPDPDPHPHPHPKIYKCFAFGLPCQAHYLYCCCREIVLIIQHDAHIPLDTLWGKIARANATCSLATYHCIKRTIPPNTDICKHPHMHIRTHTMSDKSCTARNSIQSKKTYMTHALV